MSLEAFKACDGTRFWNGDRTYVIRGGKYLTENGALYLEDARGERECSLTVNLVEVRLPDEMFCVKLELVEESPLPNRMLALGMFEGTGTIIAQGFVDRYAEVWMFAPCCKPEHQHTGFAVACSACRLLWASGAA
jgi:hypothetical protein